MALYDYTESGQKEGVESTTSDERHKRSIAAVEEEGGTWIDDIYIPPPPQLHSSQTDGRRLIITKIVNNFFKSYAHDVEIGPFHKVCLHEYFVRLPF